MVTQILVKTADNRARKAICETLVMTRAIAKLIQTDQTHQIPNQIQTGKDLGMQLLDQALLDSLAAKEIDPDDAVTYASDRRPFQRYVTDTTLMPKLEVTSPTSQAARRRLTSSDARHRRIPEGSAVRRKAPTCTSWPAIRRASACTAICSRCAPSGSRRNSCRTRCTKSCRRPRCKRFEEHDGADFAYNMGEYGRFRVNVMRQLNGMGAVMRAIPSKALSMEQLKLPPACHALCRANNGLILVTGKTGSGKSTTLAAMIDDINSRLKGHILTIEDPIEFVHRRKQCLISQREVGVHTKGFAAALQSGLREDPDVVLVGELRDYETISIAVTAAEMGILVMGTLHTNGAAPTVDRMINVFPADKQSHVRTMLSTQLRGVISQQLLQKADKSGRVAALEILVNTPAVSNLIRQGKLDQLETTMQSGSQYGMRTMDNAIEALLNQRMITGKEAYKKGISKAKFEPVKDQG